MTYYQRKFRRELRKYNKAHLTLALCGGFEDEEEEIKRGYQKARNELVALVDFLIEELENAHE